MNPDIVEAMIPEDIQDELIKIGGAQREMTILLQMLAARRDAAMQKLYEVFPEVDREASHAAGCKIDTSTGKMQYIAKKKAT